MLCFITSVSSWSQDALIDIRLNTKHRVNGIDEFDREKYITIHASIESDWSGDHEIENPREDFLNGYDVYLGRETGGLTGTLRNAKQDPNRPGFVDLNYLKNTAKRTIKSYENKGLSQYEDRLSNMIIGGQFHPTWPENKPNKKGWSLSDTDTPLQPFGTATGEFMANYIKEFYPKGIRKKPKYIEVINEPMWDLVHKKERGIASYENEAVKELAKFHSTVAKEIKKLNPDVLVGGYTCAFPDFEFYDFKRWEYRWKQFIDLTGDDMDFWSLHFYDFPCKQKYSKGKLSYIKKYRKGSNLKASLDMLEQYSMLKFGKLKPLVISEYSVQAHRYRDLPWTHWRDFLYVKSANAMMMTFMDHPQSIAMAIPFFMLKSEWGRTKDGHPYRSRLFRQEFEEKGKKGDQWVYSDLVHFYQLWSDVKGKRIDISSNNVDIQTDAYVDGKKAHIILNNLTEEKVTTQLNPLQLGHNTLKKIYIKHHYSPYKKVEIERKGIIEEKTVKSHLKEVILEPEGTMILEYTFKKPITLNATKEEVKYYASTYYQPIEANKTINFNIDNVITSTTSKAVLRLGIGRDHGKVLIPEVIVNGKKIEVPENYSGIPQTDRERFYGVLEIPIDSEIVRPNNSIKIQFPDEGGHVATATMRVFNYKNK